MALKELKTLGSDAKTLMTRALDHMGRDKDVVVMMRVVSLAMMLTWIADEIVRAIRNTWRNDYPYAANGYVNPNAVADLLRTARGTAHVSRKQYAGISSGNRALFEAVVESMALLGSLETNWSLRDARRKALAAAAAQADSHPGAAEELLLRDAISLFRHDGPESQPEQYALQVTNSTLVGAVPLHAAARVLALRARRDGGERIDPPTAEQVIDAAKALVDDTDRDRFERSVEAKGAEDWAKDGLRWRLDLLALIVGSMIRECGLDDEPYDYDPARDPNF